MKANKSMRKSIAEWRNAPKQQPCPACSGSGYYDTKGSPKCGSCNGDGIVTPVKREGITGRDK